MTLYATQAQRFGLALESVRGTAESAPSVWYPTRGPAKLNYGLKLLEDIGIRGVKAKYPPIPGVKMGDGSIPLHFDPQMLGEFFYGLLGSVASAEDSEITIDATNNKIDFDIGGGEVTGTIASASYAIGTSSASAGTLCAAIKSAMEAAEGTGTYTITYSRSTKKFTIARSTSTFSILWKTGTNGSDNTEVSIGTTLGFDTSADDAAAASQVGDNQVEYSFTHTFTEQSGIQPPSYTFFLDRSLGVLKYNRGCIKAISFKGSVDGLVEVDAEVMFQTEASGSIGSPSFPTQRYQSFQHTSFKIAGSANTNVKEWDMKIDNGAKALRTLSLSQDLSDIIAPDKIAVTGGFTIYFANTTERDKFLAGSTTSIEVLSQGDAIYGSTKWKNDLVIYDARYNAFPYDDDEGLLAAKVSYEGYYSTANSKTLQLVLVNQNTAYSS